MPHYARLLVSSSGPWFPEDSADGRGAQEDGSAAGGSWDHVPSDGDLGGPGPFDSDTAASLLIPIHELRALRSLVGAGTVGRGAAASNGFLSYNGVMAAARAWDCVRAVVLQMRPQEVVLVTDRGHVAGRR